MNEIIAQIENDWHGVGDPHRWEEAIGPYHDERTGLDALDAVIAESGLFTSIQEVWGHLLHPMPNSQYKAMRIDRVLIPTSKLISRGWRHGYIGIEGKCPGEKMGPAISQAMDYMRSVFFSPTHAGRIMLNWCVLWPFEHPTGPTEASWRSTASRRVPPRTCDTGTFSSGHPAGHYSSTISRPTKPT